MVGSMSGHLESNISNIYKIINILSDDDTFTRLFHKDIKNNFSRAFFECIKNTFEFVTQIYLSLDEECAINGKVKHAIQYSSDEDILFAYSVMIRYLVEYNVRVPNGYHYSKLSTLILDPKKYESTFDFWGGTVKAQLNFIFNQAHDYYIRVILSELNERVNKTTEIKLIMDSVLKIKSDMDEVVDVINGEKQAFTELYNIKVKETNEYLEEKEKHITALKKYLDGIVSDYNFAGLTKAYSDFYKSKNRERWVSLTILFMLAIGTILPIGIKLYTETAEKITDVNLIHYFAFSALTIIILYFFRVSLQNYNSIKAELTQIKLRMNLCMFVDNYSDFSKNKDNREALEKFENIIFSNIQPNENNIPSTFDGLEQLASLIESVTKRNK